jgi:para-nitrobenzyl esterase
LRITNLSAPVVGAFVLALSAIAHAAMVPIPGDPLQTTSGLIAGGQVPSGVKAYLGIPYAKAPVGDLRWKAPQPVQWSGVWNADRKGPECVQVLRPHNINHYFGEEPTGENCLYMNIWAPAAAKSGDKRPVIVFIYGGGGTIGSSGMANYEGSNMAKRGAVFVNFNYRVGILGFMAHPELTAEQGGHSGNYGYLDQNAALRWIHDNISQFGGDPNKGVITGQSFGASSVAAQYTSALSKGLFSGAMMSSACDFLGEGFNAPTTLAEAEKVGLEVQERTGAANLAAMRDVPADKILALQAETQVGTNVQGLRARPAIDGYFWTGSKADAFAQNQASDVPIIASSNQDDLDSNMSPLTKAKTVAEYQAIARQMYGSDAAQFLKLYPVKSDADVSAMAHQAAMEGGMVTSSRSCAAVKAKYNKTPTYIDVFAHKHPYAPGLQLADQNVATIGAYHTADVPYWFDTLDNYNMFRTTRVPTAQDLQLINVMTGALIALANTGSPSTPEFQWPAFSERRPTYALFGDTASVQKLDLKRMNWAAAHPPKAISPPEPVRPRD